MLHALEQHQHGHVRERLPWPLAGKDVTASEGPSSLRSAIARPHSGTRCSMPAFIREAGIVHTRASRLISPHCAPRTSPVRAAVRIVNSSARAATPVCLRSSATNPGISA